MKFWIEDFRFGLRLLIKHPGFATLALLALALGIGANTAIFSVVQHVLLRPLPYPEAEQLVWVNGSNGSRNSERLGVSFPDLADYRQQMRSVASLAAYSLFDERMVVSGHGEPEQLAGTTVTANFFRTLGIRPVAGRNFRDGEDTRDAQRVAIISHALWLRNFGGERSAIGSKMLLNTVPYEIVGVMPATFAFPPATAIWTPVRIGIPVTMQRNYDTHLVVGRLRPGYTAEAAAVELDLISRRLEEQYPVTNANYRAVLIPFTRHITGDIRPTLYVISGAVGFLLLIACGNIANLLLARATARRREIAIRSALGAGRARLIRQLLTESFALALGGAILGGVAAWWAVRTLRLWNPQSIPRLNEIQLDLPALLFALGTALLTALLFGLAPALQATDMELAENLKEGARGNGEGSQSSRLRNLLIMAEVAMAFVLLIGSGLLLENLGRLLSVDTGYQSNGVVTMEIALPVRKFLRSEDRDSFFREFLQRVRGLPGVTSAGIAQSLPPGEIQALAEFTVDGQPMPQQKPLAGVSAVSSGYFESMHIPLIRGRLFDSRDTLTGPKTIIISAPMAQIYFPDRDSLGKKINVYYGQNWQAEIVGVVKGVRHEKPSERPRVEFYIPYPQLTFPIVNVVMQTNVKAATLAGPLKQAMREMDSGIPLHNIRNFDDLVSDTTSEPRIRSFTTSFFAMLALGLATLGIYGVMSYSVSRRAREIGIRIAIGATPWQVIWMVLRQSMRLVMFGILAGVGLSVGLSRVLAALFSGLDPSNAIVYASVTLLLFAVSLIATAIPAWRATRIDPAIALRNN